MKYMAMNKVNAISMSAIMCCMLSPLWSSQALAQSGDQTNRGDQTEIVVTASKRPQRTQEVSGTVTAIDGGRIERLGSTDSEDIMKLTPGVQFNKGAADASLLSIRGIGTNGNANTQGFTQAPTGIYIEDVPFTDSFAFVSVPDLTPFDLERVEVLRGPQGALYGSSSLGGAVRYILAKPNLSQTQGSITAGFQSMSHGGTGWSAAGMVNLPLLEDKAALRVVLNARKDPGFIDNIGTGVSNSNSNRVDGGRVLLKVAPTENFQITAIYLRQESDQADGSGISSFDYQTGLGYDVPGFDALQVKTAFPQRMKSTFDLTTVQADWTVGGVRLTSLTGWQHKQRTLLEDFSRDFYDPAFLGDRWTSDTFLRTKNFTQELRLANATPGDFNWLIGGFYQSGSVRRDQQVFFEPRGTTPDLRFRRFGDAKEKALFADFELKVTPKVIVEAGARYYKTELAYDRITGVGNPGVAIRYTSDEDGVTPKLALRYEFSRNLAVYVLTSRGYRFGGISNLGTNPVGRPYKSDSIWNYEAGLRWSNPSGTASFDVSVFKIDWSDIQLAELYLDPASGRSFLVTGNIGKAKSTGVELAGVVRPTSKFTLRGALAYTDAVTSGGITISGATIASGTRLPGTAKLQGTIEGTANFDGPFGSGGRITALFAHTGERRAQIDSPMTLPAYSTLDLRLALAWPGFEVSAFVNNVTDTRGLSGGVDYANPQLYREFYPIRPRSFGLSARYDF